MFMKKIVREWFGPALAEILPVICSLLFLVGGFLSLVFWFDAVDVYNRHFFESGSLIFSYNICRVLMIGVVSWIVYATGTFMLATVVPATTMQEFSPGERAVLGFAVGFGIWQVLMLVLGVLGFFYQTVMVSLCLAMLAASARHFLQFVRAARKRIGAELAAMRRRRMTASTVGGLLSAIAVIWLLLALGLYPGGGGDYYTHYFYYYVDVLRNHGLSPNDVWYHYYYSKGDGLTYLAMLLTDLEAPPLVSYCTIAFSALALSVTCKRMAPRSLWPALCVVLYMATFAVTTTGYSIGGGELQKTHEELAALIVIFACIVSLYMTRPDVWALPCLIAAIFVAIGTTVLTQSAGVLIGVVSGLMFVWRLGAGKVRQSLGFAALVAVCVGAVGGIGILNYYATGLFTDQSLDLMWRFADVDRLDRWGVLPDLFLIAWIRDNYEVLAPKYSVRNSLQQLRTFLHLDLLRVLAFSGLFALVSAFTINRVASSRLEPGAAWPTCLVLTIMLGGFIAISIVAGHVQDVSYQRFSLFFVPLFVLFVVSCWALLLAEVGIDWRPRLLRIAVPAVLLISVLFSQRQFWPFFADETKDGLRFALGEYSIAEAYSHQQGGLAFGGINPAVLAAWRHVPPGARIWSTNVDGYCMAPGCRIESCDSFKLPYRITEILNGTPAQARQILQQEGLNYFIFSKDSILIDVLPYSHLFEPANIADNLAIKWTDGSTYLLTWKGSDTMPLDGRFMQFYSARWNNASTEHPWFKFREAVPAITAQMAALRSTAHPWRPIPFLWRDANWRSANTPGQK
jgi:hypothetical protein